MPSVASQVRSTPAILHDIDWATYSKLLRVFQGRRRLRLTYDRGTLEIMSPLFEHESPAYLLGRFIDVLTEELAIAVRAGRNVTLRRRKKQRGLEPDNCYWLASAQQLHGKTRLDLRVDPPPDLAVDVDVANSSLDRMSIYSALGVTEVWRFTATGLTFHGLQSDAYQNVSHSIAFPKLTPADLEGFLARLGQVDDTVLAKQFREWVHQQMLGLP